MADAIGEALDILADPAARGEIEAAVRQYRAGDRLRQGAPRLADLDRRLERVAIAAAELADLLDDRWLGDLLDPINGILPADDRVTLEAASAVDLPGEDLEHLATLARGARSRLRERVDIGAGGRRDASTLLGPPPRWVLVNSLASIWQARGHRLATGESGRFYAFVAAVAAAAGLDETGLAHVVRQVVCTNRAENGQLTHSTIESAAA